VSLGTLAVNRFSVKTPGNLPLSAASSQAESTARMGTGGGSAARCKRSLGSELIPRSGRWRLLRCRWPRSRCVCIGHGGWPRGTSPSGCRTWFRCRFAGDGAAVVRDVGLSVLALRDAGRNGAKSGRDALRLASNIAPLEEEVTRLVRRPAVTARIVLLTTGKPSALDLPAA